MSIVLQGGGHKGGVGYGLFRSGFVVAFLVVMSFRVADGPSVFLRVELCACRAFAPCRRPHCIACCSVSRVIMYYLPLFFFGAVATLIVLVVLLARSQWGGNELVRSTEPGPVSPRVRLKPWRVVKRSFKVPSGASGSSGADYSATTIDFLRQSVFDRAYDTATAAVTRLVASATSASLADMAAMVADSSRPDYGATFPVDATISKQLGFARSILPYKRKDVVYVPEISHDSKRCDEWMKTGVKNLVSCSVSRGSDACFVCIESRKYNRSCVHVPSAFLVQTYNEETITIPASSKTNNKDEGWCLPSTFASIDFASGSPVPIQESKRNCNPNTGSWILAQLGQDGGSFDSSYNWVCKCRYPSLMTNLNHSISQDCLLPVGCQPYGSLDPASVAGKVDPYVKGYCVCNKGYQSDFDKTVGPICVEKNVGDTDYETIWQVGLNNFTKLDKSFVSTKFLDLLPVALRSNPVLPDPCSIDAFSLKKTSGCKVQFYKINNTNVAMCVTTNLNYIAFTSDTDYLQNNHGRYPNSCLYTGSHEQNGAIPNSPDSVLTHAILSFWNDKNLPDVGLTYVKNSQDSREDPVPAHYERADAIMSILTKDDTYQNWRKREVKTKPFIGPYLRNMTFRVHDFFSDDTNCIVYYNDFPEVNIKYNVATMRDLVPLFRDVIGPVEWSDRRMWMVSDRLEPHLRHLYYARLNAHTYQPQEFEEYNSFVNRVHAPGCTGYGRVMPNEVPVYLTFFSTITPDLPVKRFRQSFLYPLDQDWYPAYQSTEGCTIFDECKMYHTRDEYLSNLIHDLVTSVTVGNRKLLPHKRSKRFDATLQIFRTKLFYIIMCNRYSQNYRSYQQLSNRFPTIPDGFKQYE